MTEPLKISRRAVLAGVPATALLSLADTQPALSAAPPKRPRIAALATEVRKLSHGEVIFDRFLEGFGWESGHHHPEVDLVSLYVDQFPEGDLSRERASRFKQMKIYPTIDKALCQGGDKLDVDGVVIIGEHGKYPVNDKGQTQYPRYEFFKQTVDVFRRSGRSVPVFNDKHLSWSWPRCQEMVDIAKELGFPLMSASSLPVTWRIPSIDLPLGAPVEEVLSVGIGSVDSYDFHLLESMQCLVERRKGGEQGVKGLQALKGDAVWKAMKTGSWASGGWDPQLFEACLCASQQLLPAREGFSHVFPAQPDIERMVREPVAYRFEYLDGLKGTMLLFNGLVGDITVAARITGQSDPWAALFLCGPDHDTQPFNFDPLVWHIEQFMRSGRSQLPVERTLLTSGLVIAGVDSLAQNSAVVQTPHLAIRYQPHPDSTFRRT